MNRTATSILIALHLVRKEQFHQSPYLFILRLDLHEVAVDFKLWGA